MFSLLICPSVSKKLLPPQGLIGISKSLALCIVNGKRLMVDSEIVSIRETSQNCFFCGSKSVSCLEANVPMYENKMISFGGLGSLSRYSFKRVNVAVPRCADCMHAHFKVDDMKYAGIVIAALYTFVLLVFAFCLAQYFDEETIFIRCGLIGLLAPSFMFAAVKSGVDYSLLQGRSSELKKFKYPAIEERKSQGWRLGESEFSMTENLRYFSWYRPNRGRLLGHWGAFSAWVIKGRPAWLTMFVLIVPLPLFLEIAAVVMYVKLH